jgi:type I restriction enzyme R subunit
LNEATTRLTLIDPQLKAAGWGVVEGSRIICEAYITKGKLFGSGGREKPLKVDYILEHHGRKLAVVEAKSDEQEVGEGVAQAKNYAEKLKVRHTYAANGREIYGIDMQTGIEGLIASFPGPDQLWQIIFPNHNNWRDRFAEVSFESMGGTKAPRYYQEIAINKVLDSVADGKQRILLTLATGTGKTSIAFQIAWKLFQSRWNLKRDGSRRPRILFLADRNTLANQAFGEFTAYAAFKDDALIRISPDEVRKAGRVPTNGSIFFTIFQTFMSGKDEEGNPAPYFGAYPEDFFDCIIIDECHRGGAKDESNWRSILEYFKPAVQLGLTATPKRRDNVDTYKYFGEPVYIYSLKDGINDGFLTPFKVKRITTTIDQYEYTRDDEVLEGEIEDGRVYYEQDFNRIIEIRAREQKRVHIYMEAARANDKAIVFCANQPHAAAVRDLINQMKSNPHPNYCVRVTANDGALGEQYLQEFKDNDKTIPTILTTSQKLSTGVDARNVRNIVLLRPVNNIIEFKQIVGRGTRLFDGKNFFTIYDFVDAYKHFKDPEWDGEPLDPETTGSGSGSGSGRGGDDGGEGNGTEPGEPTTRPKKIKVKLRDGKELEIQHMVSTSFLGPDGRQMTVEEFVEHMYGELPKFFRNEAELRHMWSDPTTRKMLLEQLKDAGYDSEVMSSLQQVVEADQSDLLDVLEFIAYSVKPITRRARVVKAQPTIYANLTAEQKEFLDFVLAKYVETGVEELDQEKLPALLLLKYRSIPDATLKLGAIGTIRSTFMDFQKWLYV